MCVCEREGEGEKEMRRSVKMRTEKQPTYRYVLVTSCSLKLLAISRAESECLVRTRTPVVSLHSVQEEYSMDW